MRGEGGEGGEERRGEGEGEEGRRRGGEGGNTSKILRKCWGSWFCTTRICSAAPPHCSSRSTVSTADVPFSFCEEKKKKE